MPLTSDRTSAAGNLPYHIHRHADEMPGKAAFVFLADGDDIESELTFGDLRQRAQTVSRALIGAELTGKAVVLLHPPGREFIIAFCGCLMAGAVAVPLQVPTTR